MMMFSIKKGLIKIIIYMHKLYIISLSLT